MEFCHSQLVQYFDGPGKNGWETVAQAHWILLTCLQLAIGSWSESSGAWSVPTLGSWLTRAYPHPGHCLPTSVCTHCLGPCFFLTSWASRAVKALWDCKHFGKYHRRQHDVCSIFGQFYYSIHDVSPHFKSLYMISEDCGYEDTEVAAALDKGQAPLPGSVCKH